MREIKPKREKWCIELLPKQSTDADPIPKQPLLANCPQLIY